ncbi:IbrB-like domain-containing protein [Plesiomonas shigelloides]|uniref:IbrB-like domain-containing protein n=1 Tax=Plesiomonas shigelloides TaxID=703 RepID=UPI00057A108D|nr:ParB/RepB/Spo0J family partition protein [Plesiomonas shigelloides]
MDRDSIKEPLDVLEFAIQKLLSALDKEELFCAIQRLNATISDNSPFSEHPIESIRWVSVSDIQPNNYNPNVMAPSESKLLELSIKENGFTQPIVVKEEGGRFIIIDGFHRYNLVKKKKTLLKKTNGMVPVVILHEDKRAELIVATVRHNRARGEHQITLMSDIVKELSLLGMSDEDIGVKLGMDADEVLRFRQITGLREAFSDADFSPAWTVKE